MYVGIAAQEAYGDETGKSETANQGYTRLVHVNYHKLKIMMMQLMLIGLSQLDVREDIVWAGCQYEKSHQLLYE